MHQIKLTATLFEKLLKLFEYFKIKGQRPTSFVISADGINSLNIENLVDELEISTYKTRLKRMYNMSAEILNQWNNEIYYLKSDGEKPCFHIESDYSVFNKATYLEYSVWSELHPTARMYLFDELIDYVNNFNGYCLKEFIQPPPPINSETVIHATDWSIVFYYLDGVSKKQGSKIDRMKSFIAENKIIAKIGYFKKEYHEAIRRINQTQSIDGKTLPPLPPEKIKKILPLLKKNNKAYEKAINDIDYLTNEVS